MKISHVRKSSDLTYDYFKLFINLTKERYYRKIYIFIDKREWVVKNNHAVRKITAWPPYFKDVIYRIIYCENWIISSLGSSDNLLFSQNRLKFTLKWAKGFTLMWIMKQIEPLAVKTDLFWSRYLRNQINIAETMRTTVKFCERAHK